MESIKIKESSSVETLLPAVSMQTPGLLWAHDFDVCASLAHNTLGGSSSYPFQKPNPPNKTDPWPFEQETISGINIIIMLKTKHIFWSFAGFGLRLLEQVE